MGEANALDVLLGYVMGDPNIPAARAELERILSRPPLCCFDCGFGYGGPGWCDVLVPDWAWFKISPTGNSGGILCFNCISRRLERAGLSDVPVFVVSGPFVHDAPSQRDLGRAGRNSAKCLDCGQIADILDGRCLPCFEVWARVACGKGG